MDECTNMTINKCASTTDEQFNDAIEYQNPFDRQFKLARKHNINPLRYATISNISNQATSPLNTPSISLNDGVYVGTTAINPDLSMGPSPFPIVTPNVSAITPTTGQIESNDMLKDFGSLIVTTKPILQSQRSNVVSVICHPNVTPHTTNGTVKSVTTILDETKTITIKTDVPDDVTKQDVPELYLQTKQLSNKKSTDSSSIYLVETDTIQSDQPSSTSSSLNFQLPDDISSSDDVEPIEKTFPNLIKILPKYSEQHNNNTNTKSWDVPTTKPKKKKEKSKEELLNRLMETEAMLPPKAKPGRKGPSAVEEDVKEKKKRSLERNRAAAMRCRLKKKKEVDELKTKVDMYEKQNKDLRRIIEGLIKEVRELKSEMLRHKDC